MILAINSLPWPVQASDQPGNGQTSVTLHTVAEGNVEYDYLTASTSNIAGTSVSPIPTHRGTAYCYYSNWLLLRVNPVSRERIYAVYIFNACQDDQLVVPAGANQCVNDDNTRPSTLPSTCITVEPGHVPAGIPPLDCRAAAEASVALNTDLSPRTYDPTKTSTITANTSFESDFTQRLEEGTCTNIIGWRVLGWTFIWPDASAQQLPGSGHEGITSTHTIAPSAGSSEPVQAGVTAVAHLAITGTAVDFDPAGTLAIVTRTALVDISNRASATGLGGLPTYAPPQLRVGGIGVVQNGDGSIPTYKAGQPVSHLDAICGRLLLIYPQAIVISPGTESEGGVLVGVGASTTVSWRYDGGWTDAPSSEATRPNSTGDATTPIALQYDHLEPLDNQGRTVDENVPITVNAVTTYPDGHTLNQSVSGSIPVTIYFVGLNNR